MGDNTTDYGPTASGVRTEGSGQHWFCKACRMFDGPIVGSFCDVCVDGSEVTRVVLADVVLQAVFDALSWMHPETAHRWRAEPNTQRLWAALGGQAGPGPSKRGLPEHAEREAVGLPNPKPDGGES
jgi:hypothetical protein